MRTGTRAVGWALALTLAGPGSARAAETPEAPPAADATHFSLEELGLGEGARAHATSASLTLAVPNRADRVPRSATLSLTTAPVPAAGPPRALEVLVNGEPVKLLESAPLARGGTHEVAIAPALLQEQNQITLRWKGAASACDAVPPGSWAVVTGGRLALRTSTLRLPRDLALLPLPFFDPDFDRAPRVRFAFPGEPSPERLGIAAMVAGWVGLRARGKPSFPVQVGDAPEGDAIVFVEGAEAAAKLGLPAPEGATLELRDAPAGGEAPGKWLVVAGRNARELAAAARGLALGAAPLAGARVLVPAAPVDHATRDGREAPRWLPDRAVVPFSQIAGVSPALGQPLAAGTIKVPFRLRPDLSFWLSEPPSVELRYRVLVPPGAAPPRLDVELDGEFLGRLPIPEDGVGHAVLPIHRERFGGYHALSIHVAAESDRTSDGCAGAGTAAARFFLDGGSALRLGGGSRFVTLPDLALFVHDGFPFSRRPDLGETLAVLPDEPHAAEIGALMSVAAHLAAVTGRVGDGLAVATPATLDGAPAERLDRDVLVIGAASHHGLLRRLRDRLPLSYDHDGTARVEAPRLRLGERLLGLLGGELPGREIASAARTVASMERPVAALALPSPFAAGRSVVVITAPTAAEVPSIAVLQGHAESRRPRGDLLFASAGRRHMFQVAPSFTTGQLDPWSRLLFELARHWLSLFALLALGIVPVVLALRVGLAQRVRERFREVGEEAP